MSNIFIDKGRLLVDFDEDTRNIINTIRDVDGILITEDERMYVHYIVSGLKAIGVWTKIKALYGFVGGTAATHRWNWKDMRDLDAAFRIVWNGTVTHSALGAKGDGSTGYGETHLNFNTNFVLNNTHLSIYVIDGSSSNNQMIEVGVGEQAVANRISTLSSGINNLALYQAYENGLSSINPQFLNTSIKGFYVGSRISINNAFISKDGVIRNVSILTGQQNLPNLSVWVLAMNNNSPLKYYSDRRINFVSIGDGLTQQQAIQMSHIITTAQSILGRK